MVRRGLRLIVRYVRRQPLTFALALAGATVYAISAVGTTVVLGWATDSLIIPAFEGDDISSAATGVLLALLCVTFLRAASIVLRRYFGAMTGRRTQASLRRGVVDRYLEVPLSYHQTTPTGQLLAHADNDIEAATEILYPLPFTVGVIVLIFFSVISLLLVDPYLTLVALLLFPALAVLNRVYTTRVEVPAADVQRAVGVVSTVAHESIDGAMVVKTLGREADEVARLDEKADVLRAARVRVGRIRASFEPGIDAIPNLGIVALLALGSWEISTGRITTGDMVQAMALFGLLAFPMRVVGFFLQEMPRSVVSIDRIDEVLRQPSSPVPDLEHRVDLPDGPLSVEFDGVAYGFDDDAVLRGFSLRVDPGEILAVVGSTGSGKSTMAQLLIRAADPDEGQVRVGGVDLTTVDPDVLRTAVAMVFQESFLFADSVGENISLSSSFPADPSDMYDEVVRAASTARADRFIETLPRGYETVVGERGVTLSGGQRQRVALARALVRKPRLLILDDATSAVDPTIEAEILAGLRDTLDTTTIIVAHRVSTIELADRVAYVDAGRVAATGTHDELLHLPAYEAIVRAYEQDGAS